MGLPRSDPHSFIKHTPGLALLLLEFLKYLPAFCMPVDCCLGAHQCLQVFWKCRLSFQVTPPRTPSLNSIHYLIPPFAAMLWSAFALWLGARYSFPLSCLSPFFSYSFSLPFVPFCILSSMYLPDSPYLFYLPICLTTLSFMFSVPLFTAAFLSLSASELKMDLNGWGHGELSTRWSYGCYRLC